MDQTYVHLPNRLSHWLLIVFVLQVPRSQQNTWQVHAMVTVHHLRSDIPDEINATSSGTFGGIQDYLALMSECWAQVRSPLS